MAWLWYEYGIVIAKLWGALGLIAIIQYMLFEHSNRIDNGTRLAVFFAAHSRFLYVLKSK